MEENEDWDVISVETIVQDFKMPFLADMIENNKHVEVNTDYMSGWVDPEQSGESERFLFMPVVEFKPMDNDEGFQLIIHDTYLNSNKEATASAYAFYKSESNDGYKVNLDEECHIVKEEITIADGEYEELDEFPPSGALGYENPFKQLDHDPTAE